MEQSPDSDAEERAAGDSLEPVPPTEEPVDSAMAESNLPSEIAQLRAEMTELRSEIAGLRSELAAGPEQRPGAIPRVTGAIAQLVSRRAKSASAATGAALDRLDRHVLILAMLAAIGLVELGQWLLSSGTTLVTLSPEMTRRLNPVWPQPAPAVSAIILFLLAMLLFGLTIARLAPLSAWTRDDLSSRRQGKVDARGLVLVAGGVVLVALVDLQLWRRRYQVDTPRWYLVGVLTVIAGLAWSEQREIATWLGRYRRPFRRLLPEFGAVAALLGMFVYLGTFDLDHWRYSAIGDEGSFYDYAKSFANGSASPRNLFSQKGVYDRFPVLFTYFAGQLMRIFGTDGSGWKTGTMMPVLLALIFGYLLARTLFGVRTALLCLGFFAPAHYLLAWEHTGFHNLDPLMMVTSALLLVVLGMRTGSPTLFVMAGMSAGLGWYTYYSSRTVIALLAVIVLLSVRPRRWIPIGALTGFGFILLVLPIFAVNRGDVIRTMIDESAAGPRAEAGVNNDLLPYWNLGRSLLAFNYNTSKDHYVAGALAEPITAVLFVLGLGVCLFSLRDARSRMLLVWFAFSLTTTGVLSRYNHVAITRLHYVLPTIALMAALAFDRALAVWKLNLNFHVYRWAAAAAVVVVVVASSVSNIHQWLVVDPRETPTSPTTVSIKVLTDARCRNLATPALILDRGGDGAIGVAVEEYQTLAAPDYAIFSDPTTSWLDSVPDRCVIVQSAATPEAQQVLQMIAARWPDAVSVPETDGSGQVHAVAFFPADAPKQDAALRSDRR